MFLSSMRVAARLLLLIMLSSWLPQASFVAVQPAAPVAPAAPAGGALADPPPAPAALTAPAVTDPHLPSLSLYLAVAPDPVALGDTVAITITVTNDAPDPANDLLLTLPTPDGAVALPGPGTVGLRTGWRWSAPQLEANSSMALTGTLRLAQRPAGDALLLRAQVIARGLAAPIPGAGGARVVDRSLGAATSAFTPGSAASVRSQDGRVQISFPARAAARALTLRHSTTPLVGARIPPATANFRRGMGAFFLDATDAQGAAVHQFTAPLTITMSYTPEQLDALGIAEDDLTLFWFDATAPITRTDGTTDTGQWRPIPTSVDAATHRATAVVNHFSAFQLGDGSSPSAAFLPSLQGWQVSTFTGAASYTYPIDLPAGPGGLAPQLGLSYSSAATDGDAGKRITQQAGWVGQGWSLDTGSISANKMVNEQVYYSLVFNGQSYDLLRGAALGGGTPDPNNPTLWDWRPTDESFIRVRAVTNGVSDATRGGYRNGTAYPRYTWQVWTKDGTRYDFREDAWWGWDSCSGNANMEAYKWALSRSTDTHGNTITYTYGRDAVTYGEICFHVHGQVDRDLWPASISWAYDGPLTSDPSDPSGMTYRSGNPRYQVLFGSIGRTDDLSFEGASNQYAGPGDAPHQTQRLNTIQVQSNPTGASWQLVRQYNLNYNYSLTPDTMTCTTSCSAANTAYHKLTLTSITRMGSDGATALPATTFTYGAFGYATANGANWMAGGWNRLTSVNNGQGGTLSFAYANVGQAANYGLLANNRRVSSKTITDGQGHSYTWTYSYGTPNINSLGTTRGPQSPWSYGTYGTQAYPNAAELYYNAFADTSHDSQDWLAHKHLKEFRGHDYVAEIDPSGAQTEHWFHQGEAWDRCVPTAEGGAIVGDACFQKLRDGAFLKGREYQTRVRASAGGTLLHETVHWFNVAFAGYSSTPLTGLWNAFTAEWQTEDKQYEGAATPITKTTKTFYNTGCTADTITTVTANYGNVGCVQELDGTTLVRKTVRWYTTRDDSSSYIVDRMFQESTYDANSYLLALTDRFYDGTTAADSAPTLGDLRRVTKYYDIPDNITSTVGYTLHGSDSTFLYDGYGNRTTETSYTGASTRVYNGTTTTWGGLSGTARTTTTAYDSVFHALPISVSNALSQITRADYDDRMGTLIRVTGPNTSGTPTDCSAASFSIPATEESTCAQYDVFGRMIALVKPGDSTSYPTVQATYYDTEQPFRYRVYQREQAGTGNVRVTQSFYDGLGRQIQQKREGPGGWQNIVSDTRYDGLGQVIEQSQPRYSNENSTTFYQYTSPGTGALFNHTTTSYDGLGRVLDVTTPDGSVTQTRYWIGSQGAAKGVYDANHHLTAYESDALGRLRWVYEYQGNNGSEGGYTNPAVTSYGYSPLDLLTGMSDAKGNNTSIGYDTLGRKTGISDPDMGLWSYAYNPTGTLAAQTDAKGQTISFGYDNLDRLTTKAMPGNQVAYYAYDQAGVANSIGRRTGMSVWVNSAQQSVTGWLYDARGRTITIAQTVAGVSQTINTTYDSADRVVTTNYAQASETVTYAYDAAWHQYSACGTTCYVTSATYTALDQPDARTLGNTLVQDWSYSSPMQRLSTLTVGSAFNRSYGYDAVGNIKSIGDNLSAANNQSYAYDHRDRLTSWTLGSTTQSYSYDAIGNITTKAGTSATYGANGNGTGAGPHQMRTFGSYTFSYDANGNISGGGGWTLGWDAQNLLTSATTTGVSESYTYDADGERVVKVAGGVTTVYFQGIWEQVVGGASKRYYTFNGQPIAMRDSATNTVTYLHGDHLGSVSLATNSSGAVVSTQEFGPFGGVRSGGIGATSLSYTGQQLDTTGLLYYHARYYSPVLGRFMSADSVVPGSASGSMDGVALKGLTVDFHEPGFVGQIAGENSGGDDKLNTMGPQNPQALNRYSYVQNNPLRYVDPTGHAEGCPECSQQGSPGLGISVGGGSSGGGRLVPVGAALAKLVADAHDAGAEVGAQIEGMVKAAGEVGDEELQELVTRLQIHLRMFQESVQRRDLISSMPAEEVKQDALNLWDHHIVDAGEGLRSTMDAIWKYLSSK